MSIISKEELDAQIERTITKVCDGSWVNDISVQGFPKSFDKEAVKKVLLDANAAAFKLLAAATGVAYLRDHTVVTLADCETAKDIQDEGNEEELTFSL